jgi:hypothetical protein
MILDLKIQPDLSRFARSLKGNVKGARRAGMINVITDVEARGAKNAPVRTSNLANTHTSEVNDDGSVGTVSFTAPYAGHVHQGTGLYGPHKTKIVPKKGKALFWPGAAHPVRSTKGMQANPFLRKAAEDSDIGALYVEGAERFLKRTTA